jgi:cytochrome c556
MQSMLFGLSGCHDEGPIVPAAAIKFVMETSTEPASKLIFEAAAEPPKDASGWQQVQKGASDVASSARKLVNAVRGGNRKNWEELANAMAAAGDQASAAAAAHDADALAKAGDALFATCENCHRIYQPPKK